MCRHTALIRICLLIRALWSALSRIPIAVFLMLALDAPFVAAQDAANTFQVYGNKTTIELAPVLLAAERIYQGEVEVHNGGIPNLYGEGGRSNLFAAGTADIATNAETQALRMSVDHPDLRILMTVAEGFYRIIGRRSAGIEKLGDLRGKKIGTVPRTSSAFYLHKMLQSAGLTEEDVTIVPLWPMDKYKTALANHEVDAVTIWEPGVEYAKDSIGGDAIEFQDHRVYRELFNLHTTAANLHDPVKRAKIVNFVRAIVEASERIRSHPDDALSLVVVATGLNAELIQRTWHHEGYPGIMVDDLLDVLEEEEVWVAKERNRVPRTREELATLIDDSIIKEALAD